MWLSTVGGISDEYNHEQVYNRLNSLYISCHDGYGIVYRAIPRPLPLACAHRLTCRPLQNLGNRIISTEGGKSSAKHRLKSLTGVKDNRPNNILPITRFTVLMVREACRLLNLFCIPHGGNSLVSFEGILHGTACHYICVRYIYTR